MDRPQRVHNLRHNKAEHTPARWLLFDTETRPRWEGDVEVHDLRLWCAELVERRGPSRKKPRPHWFQGHTAAELVDAVEDSCKAAESLHLRAHPLAVRPVV